MSRWSWLILGTSRPGKGARRKAAPLRAVGRAFEQMEERRVLAAPGAPLDLIPVAGDREVALTWTPPASSSPEITDYLIDYRVAADVNALWIPYLDDFTADASAVVTDLENGTRYVFRVAAVNDDAPSGGPPSATSASSTPAGLPGPPSDLVAEAGVGQARLSWAAADGNGRRVTAYTIEITDTETNEFRTESVAATNASTLSTVVGGLTNGVTYVFQVAADNGVSLGGQSMGDYSPVSEPVTPSTPPAPPAIASVEIAAGIGEVGQLLVEWTDLASTDESIGSYDVQYRAGAAAWQTVPEEIYANSHIVTGLVDGVAYSFRVAARNIFGILGDYSAASTPVVSSPLPDTPFDVTVVVDENTATLSWPEATGFTVGIRRYEVEYTTDGGATWLPQNPATPIVSQSLVLRNLARGKTYQFRVAAVTTLGRRGEFSDPSNEITQIGDPDGPSNVVIVAGNRSARLTWSDPVNAGGLPVSGFEVQYRRVTVVARSVVLGAPVTVQEAAEWTGSSFELAVPRLINGATYRFSIVTQTSDGLTSLASAPTTADVMPLPVVARLSAVGVAGTLAQPGRVVVTWSPPVMPRGVTIVDWVVQYSANNGINWETYADGVSRSAMARLNLVNGTGYRVRVAAVTTVAGAPSVRRQGDFSAPSGLAMPFARGVPLPAVTGVVSSTAGRSVSLSWTPPAGNAGGPPVRYVVQYRPATSNRPWTQHKPRISGASVTIQGLVARQSYVFRVAAVNAGGVGLWTTPTTVTVG